MGTCGWDRAGTIVAAMALGATIAVAGGAAADAPLLSRSGGADEGLRQGTGPQPYTLPASGDARRAPEIVAQLGQQDLQKAEAGRREMERAAAAMMEAERAAQQALERAVAARKVFEQAMQREMEKTEAARKELENAIAEREVLKKAAQQEAERIEAARRELEAVAAARKEAEKAAAAKRELDRAEAARREAETAATAARKEVEKAAAARMERERIAALHKDIERFGVVPNSQEVRYLRGLELERRGEMRVAMEMYKEAAESNNRFAQRKLGDIYGTGNAVVERDYQTSLKWYQRAQTDGLDIPNRPFTFPGVRR